MPLTCACVRGLYSSTIAHLVLSLEDQTTECGLYSSTIAHLVPNGGTLQDVQSKDEAIIVTRSRNLPNINAHNAETVIAEIANDTILENSADSNMVLEKQTQQETLDYDAMDLSSAASLLESTSAASMEVAGHGGVMQAMELKQKKHRFL